MKGQQRLSLAARNAAAALLKSLRTLLPVLAALLLWQGEARATHAMGGEAYGMREPDDQDAKIMAALAGIKLDEEPAPPGPAPTFPDKLSKTG